MMNLRNPGKPDFHPDRPEAPVLAWLARADFARARQALGPSLWNDYRDFVQERDALYVGFGEAGVSARFQSVPFDAFERWARLTGAAADLDGLDEFAAHWRWRKLNPRARVCGRIGAPGVPDRSILNKAGAQCIYVRSDVYMGWRRDYAAANLLAPPGLDAYAAHVVECCIVPDASARRPAVSSSYGSRAPFDERA